MWGIVLGLLVLGAPVAVLAEEPPGEPGFARRAEPEDHDQLVDEDEEYRVVRQEYAFNPVQARNEMKVGRYYSKKGSHRAAAGRYLEATRWDVNFAEAYWRLGLAREKLSQSAEAIDAYSRFLEIEPTGRRAREVGKRLAKLQQEAGALPLAAADEAAAGAP